GRQAARYGYLLNRVCKWRAVATTSANSCIRALTWRAHEKRLAARTGLPCRTGRAHGAVRGATFIIHSRHSPTPTNVQPRHSLFDRPNVYRPAPSTVEWRSFPLLCADACACRPSSELGRSGSLDISRAFWNSAQFPAARSLLAVVAAALVLSRFAAEVPLIRAIDSMLQCPRRVGKR